MFDIEQLQKMFGFTRQQGLVDALEMPVMGEVCLQDFGRYSGLRMLLHDDRLFAVNMYDFDVKVINDSHFFIVNARSLCPLNKSWEKAYDNYFYI